MNPLTYDEQFVKIRQDLCNLLINMDDKPKKNTYILQLNTLIHRINQAR